MTDAKEVSERITEYLSNGGLFNPELMDHAKVRDLLIDFRDRIDILTREREAEAAVIEAAKAFAARPSLITEQVLIGFVSTLRALEGDA